MIRTFQEADLDAIMEIWLDTNIKAHAFIPKEYWTGNFEMVKNILPQAEIYVYEDDAAKQINGFIGLTNDYIEGVFVRESIQSNGIGKLLLDHAKCKKSNMRLNVYQKNTRAIQFYLREGFVIKSENTDVHTDQKEYIMIWRKRMNLTLLGTGNALVTECYNTCFVIEDDSNYFMVDGGGGNTVLHQLTAAGIDWMDVRDIFVTHKHIDHLLGIIWLIRMICQFMSRGKYIGEANIYAHEEVILLLHEMAERLLLPKETKFIDDRFHFIEVKDRECLNIIGHRVTFFDIKSTKAKQFGFSMDIGNDEKLTCCGDEPFNECERIYAENSKWLLHEAFCLYSERDIFDPYKKHHSTVKDACELAQKLNVANLVLYHTEDRNIKNRKALYTKEGKLFFSGNLYVPDDLEVIQLE